MTHDISPDEWDAVDHIQNLKAGIPKPGTRIPGVCDHHASLALALIWIIRRMDNQDKRRNVKILLPASVVTAVGLGVMKLLEGLLARMAGG